ncbi:hypothetical protein AFM16_04960 [Streptomyces antibioticus]|uniref:Uncharacterized protein n=2 Tax=Streptomyces TaxID=1883 RepID=A0AAE6Y521_STRAT|nr:hypothetical protein AFM16_04960 [Streptomyces antibioticus]QIT42991.1 hypothetical protein HCX60_05165 [Streptomyces antibioticus]
MSPAPDERPRIRAAMDRILSETPEHSNGALTIVALAVEAGVPRNALTQRHPDLRNEFYERIRARGSAPDNERRLRREIGKLKKLRASDRIEIQQLKDDVHALVAALHLSQMENHQLLARLTDQSTGLQALRNIREAPRDLHRGGSVKG